jgi:hypothetical protein
MKHMAIALSTLLAAGLASAAPTAPAMAAAPTAAAKSHVITAEVVSTDAAAKTITIQGTPDNRTLTVAPGAAGHLAILAAGTKVKLTVHASANAGETVTHIAIAKHGTTK